MKKLLFLFLPFVILIGSAFDKTNLDHHKMPFLPNKTLDGKTINANYYKGHITLVSFMFIGCAPCMNEISTLNNIKKEYSTDTQLQIICIARQMREQMLQFNSDDKSIFSRIRIAFKADSISYAIQPACDDANSKNEHNADDSHISLKSECNTIEDVYGVTSYPTLFYVDKEGVIQKIQTGGPGIQNDSLFYKDIKNEIDLLLAR